MSKKLQKIMIEYNLRELRDFPDKSRPIVSVKINERETDTREFVELFPDFRLFGLFREGISIVSTSRGVYEIYYGPSARLDNFGERGGFHPRITVGYALMK